MVVGVEVIDQQGFWVYRWRPDDAGGTGWPGVSQFGADRVLAKHPRKITKEQSLLAFLASPKLSQHFREDDIC